MSEHQYTVGESVYIVKFNGKPRELTTVTEVKEYKRGARVTTKGGHEWDIVGRCSWGQRQIAYYTGSQIAPVTPKLDAAYTSIQAKRHAEWLVNNWNRLTAEQVEEFLIFARTFYKKISKEG